MIKRMLLLCLILLPSVCFGWTTEDGTKNEINTGIDVPTVKINGIEFNDIDSYGKDISELYRIRRLNGHANVDAATGTIVQPVDEAIRRVKLSNDNYAAVMRAVETLNRIGPTIIHNVRRYMGRIDGKAVEIVGSYNYIKPDVSSVEVDDWLRILRRSIIQIDIEQRGLDFVQYNKFIQVRAGSELLAEITEYERSLKKCSNAVATILRYILTLPLATQIDVIDAINIIPLVRE